ncbi:hypothetical protein [Streptomyces sp. GS7]|uniref:hypothetical protein n=1 Tax=Streptomyces sp. GS7 TaxID=2692234 RepID=UPI001316D9EE|nr:hypothetical protein [Streptomyces sp. GS7]QHC23232.1 hypothetical protein GR130_19300 [Streptomyces sp. GS7]
MRAQTAAFAATVPAVAGTAAVVLKAGHRQLHADRHRIELLPQPHRRFRQCRGESGWWTARPFPEMEACGCWSDWRQLYIQLLPLPAWPDEPPF